MKGWRALVFLSLAAAILLIAFADPSWIIMWPGADARSALISRQGDWPVRNALLQSEAGPVLAHLGGLLVQYIAGALILYLIPARMRGMAATFTAGWRALLHNLSAGLMLTILLIAVGFLSLLSPHTFPLPFIVLGVYFLTALTGAVAFTYQIGRSLLEKAGWLAGGPLAAFALGTVLLYTLTRLPYVGGIFLVLLWMAGAGAALTTRFGSGRAWTLEPLSESQA